MKNRWAQKSLEKYIALEELPDKVAKLREEKKSIVTINGSFDLLHSGHLEILYEASLQGDILIVALNSDESIKQYKSTKRPIIPLEERRKMISAISFVDHVTSFSETTPIVFLEKVCPDVHVNGSEYGEECLEKDTVIKNGGKIHIVSLLPGLSTSAIIEKIKKCV